MMREYHKFTLDNSNKHLLDLFYQNGTYLEIGSIDHNVLVRLLNFELIDCEDLVFFPCFCAVWGNSMSKTRI